MEFFLGGAYLSLVLLPLRNNLAATFRGLFLLVHEVNFEFLYRSSADLSLLFFSLRLDLIHSLFSLHKQQKQLLWPILCSLFFF